MLLYIILFISFAVALMSTYILMPHYIRKMFKIGMVGKDRNKWEKPDVAEIGGMVVLTGFVIGMLIYFLLSRIIFIASPLSTALFLSALFAIWGIGLIGIIDDLFSLPQKLKATLPFFFGIPLGIHLPYTAISIPFFGTIDLGIYMLILIPIAITSAANATNMLEGMNGLSTGMGIVMCTVLIVISIIKNSTIQFPILIPLLGTLIAFLYYNKYPAVIFPGDTLTLFLGSAIAASAIIGNMKEIGTILFIPMIVEFILKARGKFKAETFGIPDKNGFLIYKNRTQSIIHILMKKWKLKEWEIVFVIIGIEICIGIMVITLIIIGVY